MLHHHHHNQIQTQTLLLSTSSFISPFHFQSQSQSQSPPPPSSSSSSSPYYSRPDQVEREKRMESSAAAELSFSFGSRRIQGQEAGGFNGVGACDDMAWVVEKGNVFGLGDDFVVDDLLDFGQLETTQTEGEDDDDDDDNNNTKEEEHQNRNKKHHHQIQQQQQHSLAEDNSAVSFEPIPTPVSELTLPAHDAAELEWVSRIMDESLSEFQTYSAPKPYFPPQHMHMHMPMPMVTIPVKAKRSKRARTLSWSSSCSSSSSSWGSGVPLLFIDSSSSTTTTTTTSSSSSCSSSLSSYYYSSSSSKQKQKQKQQQQLILGHQVFDEIPVSDFYYDDGSKSNNYSCVILKKQKAEEAMWRAFQLGFLFLSCFSLTTPAAAESSASDSSAAAGGRARSLLGFQETKGNASFQCSPSGPCIPCAYSEKNDEKYRCSETGYRVPLKCVEIQDTSKGKIDNKKQRRLFSSQEQESYAAVHRQFITAVRKLMSRRLLDESSTSEGGKQSYITFRSCVPVDGEEKLSVIGFEMIMIGLLLISGPVVYMRQRRTSVMPGAVRIPSNSPRF